MNALNITVDELLCGNQIYDPNAYQTDIDILLEDCTLVERFFLFRILEETKKIVRESDLISHIFSDQNTY